MKQNYEFGRSMVEMLGILAIIGVLSIGGIAGYSYGMDKYRANETINEINMRLMTLQTQSERDMDLNLNEFSDTTSLGYTIGDNYDWAEDDTRVYVGVSGIPKQVCEIIYDEMITKVERIDVTADITTDADTLCGDNNEMKFYVGSGVEVACDPVCADDEYCMSGIKCVKAWENTSTLCSGEAEKIGECEVCGNNKGWLSSPTSLHGEMCDEGNGICSNGICIPKENVSPCGDRCPSGQYCARKRHTTDCNPPEIGCVPIDFSPLTIVLSNGKVETWYKSNKYITWPDAMVACETMGKKMPSKAEWDSMPEHKSKWTSAWSSTDTKNCTAYTTIPHASEQGKSYNYVFAYCR